MIVRNYPSRPVVDVVDVVVDVAVVVVYLNRALLLMSVKDISEELSNVCADF